MSHIIWKYELFEDTNSIDVPIDYEILDVQIQNKKVQVWIKIDLNQPFSRILVFNIFGTGINLPDDINTYKHISTLQDNSLVWHIFYREDNNE